MAQAARFSLRMQKELKLLLTDPPPGACFPLLSADSNLASLSFIDADIEGPVGTVYANGTFRVKIQIPERYPFQPPNVTFATPIYHPNIDTGGRICLDILNLPPKGAWQPSLNISTVLTSIGLLLGEPNPDDGLMCEASREYKYNRQAFDQKARFMTEKYAKAGASGSASGSPSVEVDSGPRTIERTEALNESNAEDKMCKSTTTQKKSWVLSRKLSLDSSSLGSRGNAGREANEMPHPQPLGFKHEAASAEREKENDSNHNDTETLSKDKQPFLLLLDPSHRSQGMYVHEKENAVPESISIVQINTTNSGEPCGFQLKHLESSDTCQAREENAMQADRDSRDNNHDGSADVKCDKLGSRSRKLSLGLKGMMQKFERDTKENLHSTRKLKLSRPVNTVGIGQQFSLSPLADLQQVNSSESDLAPSRKGSADVLQSKPEDKLPDRHVSDPEEDVVIVLDSEESEEENISSRRKGLLTRKRVRHLNLKGSALN